MGRPYKQGLDFFPMSCTLDDKTKMIQAQFGLKGVAVVAKLLQKIYGERGYYCDWNDDILFLFTLEQGLTCDSRELISDIVRACIKRNIFSEDMFDKHGILTSKDIQEKYLIATAKREQILLKSEYLLLSDAKNRENVVITGVSDGRNSINDGRNTQSKVKENNNMSEPISDEEQMKKDFEIIYALYPKKVGRTKAYMSYKQWISKQGKLVGKSRYKLTNRQIYLAVSNYVKANEGTELKYLKNFDTLMNASLLDYIEVEE